MMRLIPPLEPGKFYHIYNQGTNGEHIFREERNYDYFLNKWGIYIPSVAETFAYSLLPDHFQALIRIKTGELTFKNKKGIIYPAIPDRQFSHMLNGYAQGFNKTYRRSGSLFEHPFRRIPLDNKKELVNALVSILFNPQKHRLVANFRHYPHSSWQIMINETNTFIEKEIIFEWMGGKEKLIEFMDSYEQKFKEKYWHRVPNNSEDFS